MRFFSRPPDTTNAKPETAFNIKAEVVVKGGVGPSALIAAARSEYAARVQQIDTPVTGLTDGQKRAVQQIIAANAAKGANPFNVAEEIAHKISAFQWSEFDLWAKRFKRSREWPNLWWDVAGYFDKDQLEEGEELTEDDFHHSKCELLAHYLSSVAIEESKLRDWLKSGTKMVELGTSPDSCSWCKKNEGKKMRISTLIKNKNFVVHPGCRCSFLPAVD